MKFTMCVAEAEEAAPLWTPYHADQWGANPADSGVSMLAVVSGPHQASTQMECVCVCVVCVCVCIFGSDSTCIIMQVHTCPCQFFV